MLDKWTKKLPDGRTVVYTRNIEQETGGVISATVGDIMRTVSVQAPMTREEVEAEFPGL
jgi:hypothetical protein